MIKKVNGFIIRKKKVVIYETTAENGNGVVVNAETLKEAVEFAKSYNWFDGSQ